MTGPADGVFEKTMQGAEWHVLSPESVLQRLATKGQGLEDQVAAARLEEYGPNILPSKPPPTLFQIFLRQFVSPLIYVLIAAGIVALVLQEFLDAAFILVVVVVNALAGTIQERKAERSAEQLQHLLRTTTRVVRGGRTLQLAAEELVPGDIVLLESGSKVPADLRLMAAINLAVDESLLTGESVAVVKSPRELPRETSLGDRINMAFAGTTVVSGRGKGAVVATGAATEIGGIAEAVVEAEPMKPPLIIRLERLSRQISIVVLVAAVALAAVALARGIPLVDVFFFAVALAVSAIPEGLPIAVTVALAIRVMRMAKRHVIVKRLAAVEGLGSCTCIASDKTGTLTVNRQTVKAIAAVGMSFLVTGEGYSGEGEVLRLEGTTVTEGEKRLLGRLAETGIMCNEGFLVRTDGEWTSSGDPVDIAFLALGYKVRMEPARARKEVDILGHIPFEPERRYAAVLYQKEGRRFVAVKGATEAVLPHCRTMARTDGDVPIDLGVIGRMANELTEKGYRVLALASGEQPELMADGNFDEDDIPPLTFIGLAGLIDPPRPEARAAVERCACAGVLTLMVTGDDPKTALAIAQGLGIADSNEQVVTGPQLAAAGPPQVPEFNEQIRRGRVFARVTPLQKLEIVDSLKRLGHIVAVTGDGVNDAPALRRADIGVAMGSGTDVAKDAASIMITDDNFASIVAGVEEGRHAYDSIRRIVYLLISTGLAEVLLFILALVFVVQTSAGVLLPLVAVQLLWLNIVTNGIQEIALAMERGDPNVMRRRPRPPSGGIFDRLMIWQVALSGAVMGGMAFLLFDYLIMNGYGYFAASNLVFLFLVILENVHVFNCRSEYESVFRVPLRRNYFLLVAVLGAHAVHILAMNIPIMQEVLRIAPVSLQEWASLLLLSLIVVLAMELFKAAVRSRRVLTTCGIPGMEAESE